MPVRSCGTGTRSLISLRRTAFLRCLLGDGLRGEGLGIPSPLLGCHSSCLRQERCWRVRSSSWCSSWWATRSGVASSGCWVANVVLGVPFSLWSSLFLRSERSRCAWCSGSGRPCDCTAQVPAEQRERGGASDSVPRRVLQIPVFLQRRVRTVQTVRKTGDSTAQFLVRLFTRPFLCYDRCLVLDSAVKLWRFRSCSRCSSWRLLKRPLFL